jgi:uncharacterized protein (DUF342 family)
VAGPAWGALISSGGRAQINGGIKGDGKGVVRARSSIEAAFSERATLMAVGDIKLKGGAVLSFIKTNGKLTIEDEGGKLMGGVCRARHGIDAALVGSPTGGRTEISFGQDYLIKDQIGSAEEELDKVKSALSAGDKKIQEAAQNPAALEKARNEKVRLMKILEQLKLKVFTLREKFEEHYESEVKIRGTIYPGVVIESHDRYYEVQRERSRVIFYFDRESGRVREKPMDQGSDDEGSAE